MHQLLDPTEEEQVVQQLEEYSRNGCVHVCYRLKDLEAGLVVCLHSV